MDPNALARKPRLKSRVEPARATRMSGLTQETDASSSVERRSERQSLPSMLVVHQQATESARAALCKNSSNADPLAQCGLGRLFRKDPSSPVAILPIAFTSSSRGVASSVHFAILAASNAKRSSRPKMIWVRSGRSRRVPRRADVNGGSSALGRGPYNHLQQPRSRSRGAASIWENQPMEITSGAGFAKFMANVRKKDPGRSERDSARKGRLAIERR